jgi:hypothetical protein
MNEVNEKKVKCMGKGAYFLPISLLASKIVLEGFRADWFFAASPMRRSRSVKATYDGVVLLPMSFACKEEKQLESNIGNNKYKQQQNTYNDFHSIIGPHTNTRVSSAEVDSYGVRDHLSILMEFGDKRE